MKILILILTLISVTRAVVFNCTFQMVEPMYLFPIYTCYAPTLSNIESETVTSVYGNHMSGKTNIDVGYIHISSVSLTFFPKGIEKFFPNLIAMNIFNGNMSTLNGHELDGFKNLTWFRFDNQKRVERIPGNLFANTPLMRYIFIESNPIKHVGENLLDSLSQLQSVSFRYNYCVNEDAYKISELPSLIEYLRTNCTDIEEPPCDVCAKIDNMAVQNEVMSETINSLVEKNVETNVKLSELSQENSQIRQMLNEVLAGILELTTRP